MNEATARFHSTIRSGSLEELRAALASVSQVDAPGHTGKTALMIAIDANDLEKVKLLIAHGADPELTDDFNATALRTAVDRDFVDAARLLLGLGVDRGHQPKYPLKKIDLRQTLPVVPMPPGLEQVMSAEEWQRSVDQVQESMLELGQNPVARPLIADVQSVEMLKLFLEAGDDLIQAPNEVKRAFIGLPASGELQCSLGDYKEHRSPKYGKRNPEPMDYPFWRDMISTGSNAYTARQKFKEADPFRQPGPVWCYDRFGSSLTPLPDGRFVQIAGEHEDYYDPDFCIYNDVVVHDGRGGFLIFGYPSDVFPPTDFHTATLVGDFIYIVGGLGYIDQRRAGATPVYRLRLNSWEFETVRAQGEPPGWIFNHRSLYDQNTNVIRTWGGELHVVVDGEPANAPNEDSFELDLTSLEWRKLS